MLIDFHIHMFPDALAEKAIARLAAASGLAPETDGTKDFTLQKLREWEVDRAVVLNIATNPRQQTNVNNFAISCNHDPLIPFGSVHFESECALEELERIKGAGLRGVKLHPDYQGFEIDERRLYPIYERIAELGLVCVFHTGFDAISPDHIHATPQKIARVLRDLPQLTMVCAHMGSMERWDEVEQYLCGKRVYFDTAFTAGYLSPAQAERIISRHGAQNILFGSDCPWQASSATYRFIDSLHISSAQKDMIFYQNAQRLLGL